MGFSDDVMRGFVLKEMGRIYPSSEGWQYQVVGDDIVNGQEFLLTRRMAGRTEHVRLIVSFAKKVTLQLIQRFSQMADTAPYAGIKNIGNVLLVPQTADISLVPDAIRVRFMHSFAYRGKDLIWLKKYGCSTRKDMDKCQA